LDGAADGEAFPADTVPRYLVRDRDGIYGHDFTTRVDGLGIRQVQISARRPWQNCYAERLIGSIRRERLNHVIVINEWHLRRILKSYFRYYHRSRTHLSLDKDAPESRPVQDLQAGRIIQIREVGGLHHRYERRAAAAQLSDAATQTDCRLFYLNWHLFRSLFSCLSPKRLWTRRSRRRAGRLPS
jgi:putative transposase